MKRKILYLAACLMIFGAPWAVALDNFKNFAKSAIVPPGISAAATSITVTTGTGTRFPTPPFNATVWNSTDYRDASDDPSVEIVRVTAIVGDTLTVTRAQESTTAVAHNTFGKTYRIVAGWTAKSLTEIGTLVTSSSGWVEYPTQGSPPAAPVSGFRLFADASARFAWIGANGRIRTFDGTGITADRVYTLPDASGTVALTSSNVATATALAADPSACGANQFANDIAANGTLACAQPSAANLSNGTTGSGSVVLATSPALTSTPTAPTAAVDTNTTQIATTGFVIGQGYLKSATAALTYAPITTTVTTDTTQTISGAKTFSAALGGSLGVGATAPAGFQLYGYSNSASATAGVRSDTAGSSAVFIAQSGNGTTSGRSSYFEATALETVPQTWRAGMQGNTNFVIRDATAAKDRITLRQDVPGLVGINGSPTATFQVRPADAAVSSSISATAPNTTGAATLHASSGDGTTSSRSSYVDLNASETTSQRWIAGMNGSKNYVITDITGTRTPLSLSQATGAITTLISGIGSNPLYTITGSNSTDNAGIDISSGDGTTSSRQSWVQFRTLETVTQAWRAGMTSAKDFVIRDSTAARNPLTISQSDGRVTISNGFSSTASTTSQFLSSGIGAAYSIDAGGLSSTDRGTMRLRAGDGTTSSRLAYLDFLSNETVSQTWRVGMGQSNKDWSLIDATGSRTPIAVAQTDGLVTVANGIDASTGDQRVKGAKLQSFVLTIFNNAGTLQHAIRRERGSGTAGNYYGQISGSSTTLTNTPSVAAGVDFTAGAGIDAAAANAIVLSTAAQTDADLLGMATVEQNDTGSVVWVSVQHSNINVNGTTRVRLTFNFFTTTGTFSINTANIGASKTLSVRFMGYIK